MAISADCTIRKPSKPESGERLCWEPTCRGPIPKGARKWCNGHGGRFQRWLRNHKWWAAREYALLEACVGAHPKGTESLKRDPRNMNGYGVHGFYQDPCEVQCAICKAITGSPEVDHKIPMGGDARNTVDCRNHESNLRVLCSDCHKEVTAVQSKARAAARKGKPQMKLEFKIGHR